jgi:hypothetical protein
MTCYIQYYQIGKASELPLPHLIIFEEHTTIIDDAGCTFVLRSNKYTVYVMWLPKQNVYTRDALLTFSYGIYKSLHSYFHC